ncbi:MAG: two-component system response regulator, partial [Hyphomicrobium sp.]
MSQPALPEDHTLLILDDDKQFRERLGRAMESRGFDITICESLRDGIAVAREKP